MIYYATTKRDADRMALAMFTLTGEAASRFVEKNQRGKISAYRVQLDSIGSVLEGALRDYLADGGRADLATRKRIAAIAIGKMP